MIKVDGYVCDYCKASKDVRRVYATSGSCGRHEKSCYRNPASKACATCSLWQEVEIGVGTHEEPAATVMRKFCRDNHDRVDTGMCNGSTYQAAPQRACDFWIAIELD